MENDANDQAEMDERAAETESTENQQIWETRPTKSDPIGGHLAEAEAQLAEDEPAGCNLDQPMQSEPLQDYHVGESQPVKDCEMADPEIIVKPVENEEEIKGSAHEGERCPGEAVERGKEFSSSANRTVATVNGSAPTGNGSAPTGNGPMPTGNGPMPTGNGPVAAGNEREDEESRMEDESESMASLETTYTSLRDNGVEPTLQFRLIRGFLLFESLFGKHNLTDFDLFFPARN